jgi:hypothetical protein
MSAVTSTSVAASARLSAKTSLRNSRSQRISAAARPNRRVNRFVVKAEEAVTNGNGTSRA